MGKLFLLLLVVLGAALYFPETRADLIARVEPVIEPALGPIRLRETQAELKKIAEDMSRHERLYDRVPTNPDMFRSWLYTQYVAPSNYEDAWGREFSYKIWPDSFAILSSGPDKTWNTPDDLSSARERVRPGRR